MLKNVMIKQGHWLFRWRSYLPLLVLPLAMESFLASGWMTSSSVRSAKKSGTFSACQSRCSGLRFAS